MSTAATIAPSSSRLLPKIVHPATKLKQDGQEKITVEVRQLSSAKPRSRSRPLSCPEMSIDHLINTSSRIRSSRLQRLRTCSARQQRSSLSAGQSRLANPMTVEEVSMYHELAAANQCHEDSAHSLATLQLLYYVGWVLCFAGRLTTIVLNWPVKWWNISPWLIQA